MHRFKRWLCLLLSCSLLLGGLVYQAPEASAYMATKPLPELTGNTAQDVANIAISQLGYHEVGGGTAYGAWWSGVTGWGDYTYLGWCAMFANWCAYQAGAGMDISYNKYSAIVGNHFKFVRDNGFADRSFDTAPQPGDFIYFGHGDSFGHVAVVVGYDAKTNKVTFVGGNQGDAVTQGTVVWSGSTKWGSQYVLGYSRPNYGSEGGPVTPTCTCEDYYEGYYKVTTTKSPLNIRSGHNTYSAIVGSIPMGAEVYVAKAQEPDNNSETEEWAHVQYNGMTGYASMKYLERLNDHEMNIHYADNGTVIDAEVIVYDHVEKPGFGLQLNDRIPAARTVETAVPIRVSIPDPFQLTLTVPVEQASSGNIFVAKYADGTTKVLEDTVVSGRNISIDLEGDVTLYIIDQSTGFPDIPDDFWAKAEIDYMTSRGLMSGKLDGTFAPNETITRGTVAMMLWRMAGYPEVEGASPFSDVTGGRYLQPILWAQSCGIIAGYKDGTFRPNEPISRQHFSALLHRYALYQEYLLPAVTDKQLTDFSDYSSIYNWARESCQWAVTCGIVAGRVNGKYDPQGGTSRAQMAVILTRFLQAVNQSENLD